MRNETIEIPIDLYRALINEHLFHQLPNGSQIERNELIEAYIQLAKEKYWEEEDV